MAIHGEINPSTADLILGTATNALDTARGLQTRRSGSVYVEDGANNGGGIVFGNIAAEYQGAARVDADGNMSPLVDTSQLEQDIKTAADTAQNAADSAALAVTQANQASQNAQAASKTAAEAAVQAAEAAGVAGEAASKADAKSSVLIQSSAPSEQYQSSLTLWIDTTDNANTPKRWDGSAWVAVTDKQAVEAAAKAVEAKTAADNATAAAKDAATDAASALVNANSALARATHVTTGMIAPTENVEGDIWFPANEQGNVIGMKTWAGSAWVDVQLVAGSVLVPGSVGATTIADGAITTPKLTVTEDMMVALLKAHKIEADEIDLNTLNGHTINGIAISGSTVTGGIFQTAASGYRLRIRNTKFVTDDMTIDPDRGDNEIGVFVRSSHGVLEFLKDDTSLGALGFTSENGTIGVALGLGQQNNFIVANNGDEVSVGSAGTVNITGTTSVLIDSTGTVTINNAVLPKPTLSNATINTATINTATLTKPTLLNATVNTATLNTATLNTPTVKDSLGSAVVSSGAINHLYASYEFCRTDGQKKLNNGNTYMKLFNKTGNLTATIGNNVITGLASGTYYVEAGMTTNENGTNSWRTLLIETSGAASKIGWGRDEYNTSGGYSMLNANCIVKITGTSGCISVVGGGNKTGDMRANGKLTITRI